MRGSWLQSQNAELSLLLASSSVVLASQKRLQSEGSGGSWSPNSELSSRLASPVVLASQIGSTFFGMFFAFSLELCFAWSLFRVWGFRALGFKI